MKARIIHLGDSRYLRIPQTLLEQSGIGGEVELEARRDHIVIRAARHPRAGWDAAFKEMRERGDDILLDDCSTTWDEHDWKW